MGAFYDTVPNETLMDWIRQQKLFFVSSSPLSSDAHVNCSPKGHDALFTLVDDKSAYYVDLTGSGNETISCLYEGGNGRITILFVAFEGPPRIVRLFGKGKVFERGSPEFEKYLPPGDPRRYPGTRAIIWIDIHKVGTSCGYSVPFFEYKKERNTLLNFMDNQEKKEGGMKPYWNLKNSSSVDGLPGPKVAEPDAPEPREKFTLEGSGGGPNAGIKMGKKSEGGDVVQDLMARLAMLLLGLFFAGWLLGLRITFDEGVAREARQRLWGTLAI
ncbi:hypothetical protein MVLG_05191 [Microbotryum lychnidis-dioicae p1A1 Lamole]|uniref:BQ5605_C013g07378 protein n=2 Tax=Microbotryum TaxID=34416 RepID=A0A2X0NVX6_9BASI|nr:hypothetical protein MVLG_05191 [Microbotryum lychnidis-dioicae p1A1 Lamole]SGY15476.1 BQ5605_C013g07378 [Microbotryum silenes-dioicae]|eukprot:KDE04401.1 hypothetical protein MVLG_05191 [Microbotryum lychnidis-dioicae p1A1 Lamole]